MFGWRKKATTALEPLISPRSGIFSTQLAPKAEKFVAPKFKAPSAVWSESATGQDSYSSAKPAFGAGNFEPGIPDAAIMWFAGQSFIGYQISAILSQHWLINKACRMPGRDAVRKGWEIKLDVKGGGKPDPDAIKAIQKADKKYRIKKQLEEFVGMGRIFGIRIALFDMDVENPEEYYKNPFNPDAIKPNMYRGITQIDPYWVTPEMSTVSVSDPSSQRFYEPTFWRINGISYHHSHLVIYTTGAVPDILKPNYFYGGVSVPQRIAERVYAAETTANEAPLLAMSKRLTVLNVELEKAMSKSNDFARKMEIWTQWRDNLGVKVVGTDEKVTQFDTALSDMDLLIMTQYQLVAAIAEVPGTKLLGTQPKGFNSTGEFEESSYHEFLESIQENDLTPLLDKHHLCLLMSEIQPEFGKNITEIEGVWNKLDAMTELELAQLNLLKSQNDEVLVATGSVDAQDSRTRLINDDQSGYNDLSPNVPVDPAVTAALAAGGQPDGQGGVAPPDGADPGVAGAEAKLSPARPKTPSVPAPKGA